MSITEPTLDLQRLATRKEIDDTMSSLAEACRSVESLVAGIEVLIDSDELEKAMLLVEILNRESLILFREHLPMSVERAEGQDPAGGPFKGVP
jgi:hypothetical protein